MAKVWVYLADDYVRPLEAYPIAKAAAEKALALKEGDGEAHCFLAVLSTIAFYPGSQELRADSRFTDLVTRVGLDPATAIPPTGH